MIVLIIIGSDGHGNVSTSYISTQISRFMWSTPADTLTPNRSPTFAVLHHDGSVEVFDVQKKSVLKKQVEEKCLTHIGLLKPADIKGVLKGAIFITN